ncbi:hypothetical protein AB4Z19_15430 [Pseudoduganella sp. RAF19]
MTTTTNPPKEQVRHWMHLRQLSSLPPAKPEEIRRQLGWNLIHRVPR